MAVDASTLALDNIGSKSTGKGINAGEGEEIWLSCHVDDTLVVRNAGPLSIAAGIICGGERTKSVSRPLSCLCSNAKFEFREETSGNSEEEREGNSYRAGMQMQM